MILFEETLYQKTDEGKDFSALLREKGIIVGIKVTMFFPLAGSRAHIQYRNL